VRYHNYILFMLKKEREMEKHFCDKCGQQSTEPMPVVVSKHVRNDSQDYKFCSRECHDEFYLDRLRNLGL
jgi:hypothetical protein